MENLTRARKALSYLESVEQRIGWIRTSPVSNRELMNVKFMLAELRNAQTLIKNMVLKKTPKEERVRGESR